MCLFSSRKHSACPCCNTSVRDCLSQTSISAKITSSRWLTVPTLLTCSIPHFWLSCPLCGSCEIFLTSSIHCLLILFAPPYSEPHANRAVCTSFRMAPPGQPTHSPAHGRRLVVIITFLSRDYFKEHVSWFEKVVRLQISCRYLQPEWHGPPLVPVGRRVPRPLRATPWPVLSEMFMRAKKLKFTRETMFFNLIS